MVLGKIVQLLSIGRNCAIKSKSSERVGSISPLILLYPRYTQDVINYGIISLLYQGMTKYSYFAIHS